MCKQQSGAGCGCSSGMTSVYTSQTVNCLVVVAVVLAWWLVYTAVTSEMASTEDTGEAVNKSGH